jgi:predicted transcriptional regulator
MPRQMDEARLHQLLEQRMEMPSDRRPRRSVRMDAALDEETRAKLEELTTAFHRSRAVVLRHVMQWGLGQVGPVAPRVPRQTTPCFFMVDADLHRQVRETAQAAGIDVAPWVRHMMRQIRPSDFPKSWQVRTREPRQPASQRSHDSRYYGTRFMLRLDVPARARLEALASHFDASQAELIRQLIIQAKVEDFPPSWHLAAGERRRRPRRRTP